MKFKHLHAVCKTLHKFNILYLDLSLKVGLSIMILLGGSVYFSLAQSFPANINLDTLGSNGITINGIDIADYSGFSISDAGDINNDGIDDLIVGAWRAESRGNLLAGESYVIFGSSNLTTSLALSSLNGSNGFTIKGIDENDLSGISASGAGDVNGDGLDDLIIGASGSSLGGTRTPGEIYVVFGSSNFPAIMNLSNLNGINGFIIEGTNVYDSFGRSVSGVGDMNGDGLSDVIIGANSADVRDKVNAGKSFVIFGSSDPITNLSLSNLNGSNGFVINGIDAGDYTGSSVSGVGDINGDGLTDVIIGAHLADPVGAEDAGKSYVIFGSNNFTANLELSDLNGSNGFVISGTATDDYSGVSVSGAGDVNGDGLDDLIIGASGADFSGNDFAGASYVVFGSRNFGDSIALTSLDGTNGFVINGIDFRDFSGRNVSAAGDVNGDGLSDLIVGAYTADPQDITDAGETYVIFGFTHTIDSLSLSDLDGNNGFTVNGIYSGDQSGHSVSGAGDLNADGIDDLIIGAPGAWSGGNNDAGQSYVIFGRRTTTSITPEAAKIPLEVFPNPASTTLTVRLPDLDQTSTLSVFDLLGREIVVDYSRAGDRQQLDIVELPQGSYVLRVQMGGNVGSARFVKR